MIFTPINRFILLALLPIIAFIVYREGQTYDPALLQFTSSDISTGEEISFFPRSIEGFSRSGQVRLYSKENLYEYVNGHAEYFLSAGFIRLAVGEYVKTGAESAQSDAVVDIYDMGKDIQAFGVLADETGDALSSVQDGIMGARTPQGMSFASGRYYVKIAAYDETIPLDLFAVSINRSLGSSSETLSAFSRLPTVGTAITTRFVKEDYRGLDFVHNVVEREYRIEGKTVQVFLFLGTGSEIKELVASYLAFFRESDIEYSVIKQDTLDIYQVIDPFEGDWYLVPAFDELYGIFGEVDKEILHQFLVSIKDSDNGKRGS
ncbi:MAG: hypothetical protein JSV13_00480 [Nitrospiraceae bacterium]|nr:MAG: hypothetical protein JSV13_00480 [Nitrospiraceae bacterium]